MDDMSGKQSQLRSGELQIGPAPEAAGIFGLGISSQSHGLLFKRDGVWGHQARALTAPGIFRPSEQQLRLILENTSDSVFVFSMSRELIYANAAVEKLTGYSGAEIRARRFINWIYPDDQEAMVKRWEALYRGEGYENVEFRLVAKSGQIKWCASTWGPLFDQRGAQIGVHGRERDITVLKRGEMAQRELAAIVENSQDAIFSMSLDGTIVSWNRAASRIYGYGAREIMGKPVDGLLKRAGAKKWAAVLREGFRGQNHHRL